MKKKKKKRSLLYQKLERFGNTTACTLSQVIEMADSTCNTTKRSLLCQKLERSGKTTVNFITSLRNGWPYTKHER